MLAILLLEQSECRVLSGRVQVVHLCERFAHEGIILDRSAMASLCCVHLSVPVALDEVYLV